MPESRELDPQECARLLRAGVVGRVALSTPDGPHIVPVNYSVFEDTIVVRTSAYSILGTYGRDAMLAFEVDHLDYERHVGWSVVVRGRGWAELEPDEITRIRAAWQPHPWASGQRNLYLRIRWETLSGRSLGTDWTRENESPVHRTLTAL
ncbi:MAG TPA: pyridoxamine 5'-phosphate oxidase family protein [Marmoricola sp.]|nr:pyridoxamine 5'-phosphate oxidase family protein [Marmoricola sp.]